MYTAVVYRSYAVPYADGQREALMFTRQSAPASKGMLGQGAATIYSRAARQRGPVPENLIPHTQRTEMGVLVPIFDA